VSELDRQPDFLPDKYESGSHNAIGIIGLSEGVQWILSQGIDRLHELGNELSRTFMDQISEIEGLGFFGPRTVDQRVGVFSVQIDGFDPHELSAVLESHFGILTRPGIHCAPLAHEAIGTTERGGTTRLSFGPFLTVDDVKYAAESLAEIANSNKRESESRRVGTAHQS
jgi:selenocysteine lyase/cysteine desulfurase